MTYSSDTSAEAMRQRREDLHRDNRRQVLIAQVLTLFAFCVIFGLSSWWLS